MRHRILLSALLVSFTVLAGCFTSSPPSDILAINPLTGETRSFTRMEDVPDGWEVCADDGTCPSPLACGELDEPSCLARADCSPVYAEGDPTDPDPYAGCIEVGPPTCEEDACGPGLEAPAYICPDGSIGGNTGRCLANADGTCGWELRECPMPCDCGDELPAIARICPDGSTGIPECQYRADGTCGWEHVCPTTIACTPEECDPAPGVPSMICEDGTVAGPMCERDPATGTCGWIITSCPGDPCDPATGVTCPECDPAACGPAPAIAALCPDGSTAEMVCAPGSDGTAMCGWRFICPGGTGCDPAVDCGPPPGADPMCPDGSSASVGCEPDASGTCGWVFSCPPASGGGDGSRGCADGSGVSCDAGLECCAGIPYPADGICHASCPAISDRNQKMSFSTIDPASVLARVVDMPITEWSYRQEPNARHLGPMAQDFHARFGLGEDERHIHPVDGVGVSLLAIQALNERVDALAGDNARLVEQNTRLLDRLEQLERRGR